MPIPASILPTAAVTEPSAATRIHEASDAGSTVAGHAPPATGRSTASATGFTAQPGIAKETTSAPPVFRKSRRARPFEVTMKSMAAS